MYIQKDTKDSMDPKNITRATTWVGLQLPVLESTGSAKNSKKLNYQMKLEMFRNKIETKPKPKDTHNTNKHITVQIGNETNGYHVHLRKLTSSDDN